MDFWPSVTVASATRLPSSQRGHTPRTRAWRWQETGRQLGGLPSSPLPETRSSQACLSEPPVGEQHLPKRVGATTSRSPGKHRPRPAGVFPPPATLAMGWRLIRGLHPGSACCFRPVDLAVTSRGSELSWPRLMPPQRPRVRPNFSLSGARLTSPSAGKRKRRRRRPLRPFLRKSVRLLLRSRKRRQSVCAASRLRSLASLALSKEAPWLVAAPFAAAAGAVAEAARARRHQASEALALPADPSRMHRQSTPLSPLVPQAGLRPLRARHLGRQTSPEQDQARSVRPGSAPPRPSHRRRSRPGSSLLEQSPLGPSLLA